MTGRTVDKPSITSYYRYQSIGNLTGAGLDSSSHKFRGPTRVVIFCLVTVLLPCLLLMTPLYLRYEYYKDVTYNLGESDLVTVDKPISTFWCAGHDLWMNATFHAYLLDQKPQISEDLQEYQMDKHMQLADDSLEYWGFFLLQGSKVTLSVCSRFDGARLMVVKGTKNLKHCALLDPTPNDPDQVDPWEEDVSAIKGEKIEVTFQRGDDQMPHLGGSGSNNPGGTGSKQVKGQSNSNAPGKSQAQQPAVNTSSDSGSNVENSGNGITVSNSTGNGPSRTSKGRGRQRVRERRPQPPPPPQQEQHENKSDQVTMDQGPMTLDQSSVTSHPGTLVDPVVQTAHENMKVARHKHRHQLPKPNRTRRFVSSQGDPDLWEYQDQDHPLTQNEPGQGQHHEEEDPHRQGRELSLEEDTFFEDPSEDGEGPEDPPNPVGVEPLKSQIINQAQNQNPQPEHDDPNDPHHSNDNNNNHEGSEIDQEDIRSSGSSFAKNLWSCYGGDVLTTQTFSPSPRCRSQDAMMKHAIRMKTVHEITSTGYYYYIFYSDNDIVSNDIFARFNIDKVVYNFPNYTNSCLNSTSCSLPLGFLSSEKVLLEVPLQDGVSDEDALAQMVLVSTCRPRLGVYFIFPVLILICILCCAFI